MIRREPAATGPDTTRQALTFLSLITGVALMALVTARPAEAQGTVTHGALQFEFLSDMAGAGGNANLVWQGVDQLHHLWWWYRVDGDSSETRFPEPDSQQYTGEIARLEWTNVDGRGFDALLDIIVTDCAVVSCFYPGEVATVLHYLIVQNTGGSLLDISVFAHVDPDLGGTSGGDLIFLTGESQNSRLTVMEGPSSLVFANSDSDAYQAAPFQLIRNELDDGDVDNLNNSGVPSGPNDLTLAEQFDFHIDPDTSEQAFMPIGINNAIFIDGFESGDTSRWN
jgi:hypothetical protein